MSMNSKYSKRSASIKVSAEDIHNTSKALKEQSIGSGLISVGSNKRLHKEFPQYDNAKDLLSHDPSQMSYGNIMSNSLTDI